MTLQLQYQTCYRHDFQHWGWVENASEWYQLWEPGTKFNLEHWVSTLLLSVFGVRFAGAAERFRCLTGLRTSSEFSQ